MCCCPSTFYYNIIFPLLYPYYHHHNVEFIVDKKNNIFFINLLQMCIYIVNNTSRTYTHSNIECPGDLESHYPPSFMLAFLRLQQYRRRTETSPNCRGGCTSARRQRFANWHQGGDRLAAKT